MKSASYHLIIAIGESKISDEWYLDSLESMVASWWLDFAFAAQNKFGKAQKNEA